MLAIVVAVLLLVIAGVGSFVLPFLFSDRQELSTQDADDAESRQPSPEKAKEIIARVRRHIQIPDGFEPTIAEVIDAGLLREKNMFYVDAMNGDFLVVTASLAILYRPSTDIILNVIPVTLER